MKIVNDEVELSFLLVVNKDNNFGMLGKVSLDVYEYDEEVEEIFTSGVNAGCYKY
jgi:hypothetical protein